MLFRSDAACNISATISCDAVAQSEFSEVLGIPLGVWGAGYFLALLMLLLLGRYSSKQKENSQMAYSFLVLCGILCTLTLGGISYFVVRALCPTCLLIYFVCLMQGINIYLFSRDIFKKVRVNGLVEGLSWSLVPIILALAIFRLIEPSMEEILPTKPPEMMARVLSPTAEKIPLSKSPYAGLGEDYRLGKDDAKVVITEFSDFQCPACKYMNGHLKAIKADFGDQILLVYRNYPLDGSCNTSMGGQGIHPYACKAAKMARCAGKYGKFWPYHDLVFENQDKISEQMIELWAKSVGLNSEQIQNCSKNKGIEKKIEDDIALAQKLGVDSTPTLYINGHRFVGRKIPGLRREIEKILNN